LEAVRKADGVIANLTPFRGSEPDSGTVTECAIAYAWGKPVIGYFSGPALPVPKDADADGRVLAEGGGWIEQFGLSHNLMLHGVCADIVDDPLKAVVMMAGILERPKTRGRKAASIGFGLE
jgi:nucleoside 2-deoxyribosyltransferase